MYSSLRIFNYLCSPDVVSYEMKGKCRGGHPAGGRCTCPGWTAKSLLVDIAQSEDPFHALIDTGALVTGMDNEEVAEVLLEHLPQWYETVSCVLYIPTLYIQLFIQLFIYTCVTILLTLIHTRYTCIHIHHIHI